MLFGRPDMSLLGSDSVLFIDDHYRRRIGNVIDNNVVTVCDKYYSGRLDNS